MATLVLQFGPLTAGDGSDTQYSVQACGVRRDNRLWEGWLAFFDAAGNAWRTDVETVQPNRAALEYWASGLSPVYLEGALDRARPTTPEAAVTPLETTTT